MAISAATRLKSHKIVRPFLKAATPVAQFLAKAGALTPRERACIVDQAIMLLEGFYAHLPFKRETYAVDPLRRLKLLRHRIPKLKNDALFHAEMTDIFTSIRDLHTNYLLPVPFNAANAWLPFKVEVCGGDEDREYLVGKVAHWFTHPTFRKGVQILYWNGVPIARAVELAGAQSAGGNPAARLAQGLLRLTARPLIVLPPPDEEWVTVRYRYGGREYELRFEWLVTGLPADNGVAPRGLSVETERIRQINKFLFAPTVIEFTRKIARAADPVSLVKGTDSVMPDIFRAAAIKTDRRKIGYIRIFSFDVPNADNFVSEFVRLTKLLPQNGLVIDVRDNGGGRTAAAERLLQIISPRQPIEPQRLYFINTPLTLELCQLQKSNLELSPKGLSPWIDSMQRSLESGAIYSASFPYTDPKACNSIGHLYPGPAIVITNALSYSATEFFAAGFQDHGGKVLGVDKSTGGGGANVRTHQEIRRYFKKARQSPFTRLPKKSELRVAFRRAMRVGAQFGNEIEDFGVTPDFYHPMTRNDLLNNNVDLIEYAASLLRRV
jgi:C-terminal processing protease CtpA/Prc